MLGGDEGLALVKHFCILCRDKKTDHMHVKIEDGEQQCMLYFKPLEIRNQLPTWQVGLY